MLADAVNEVESLNPNITEIQEKHSKLQYIEEKIISIKRDWQIERTRNDR